MAGWASMRSVVLRQLGSHADAFVCPMPLTGVRQTCKPLIPRSDRGDSSVPCSFTRQTTPARGLTTTASKHRAAGQRDHENKPRRRRPLAMLTIAILSAALLSATTGVAGSPAKGVLNGETFVPFSVVSTERTSPTTFILTVAAPAPHAAQNASVARDAWAHGLWSVEVKQPQLQIARSYTPLPPEEDRHQLRFLIRRYDGGEMSTYLSRLGPGDEVWLRGPHLGFDVAARLGAAGGRKVVFLAGGTGVAPALQVARLLLSMRQGPEDGRLSMEIIWANRARADCAGCPRLYQPGGGGGFWGQGTEDGENPVVRQMRHLQAAYKRLGHELEVRCAADDEAGSISGADVTRAIEPPHTPSPSTAARVGPAEQARCCYHSQNLLQHSTPESDAELKGKEGRAGAAAGGCVCRGNDAGGKNLLMISGPDGFVGAYVGPKVWADGAERQGPVGGLVRKLIQTNPEAWRDWLILKQ